MGYCFYSVDSPQEKAREGFESAEEADINTQNTNIQPRPCTDGTDPLAAATALLTEIL